MAVAAINTILTSSCRCMSRKSEKTKKKKKKGLRNDSDGVDNFDAPEAAFPFGRYEL